MIDLKSALNSEFAYKAAGITALKLNELVSRGYYTAPKTTPGASREFSMEEICALHVLARLLEIGFTSRVACSYALRFRQALEEHGYGAFIALQMNAQGKVRLIANLRDFTQKDATDGIWITINLLDVIDAIGLRMKAIDHDAIAKKIEKAATKKGKR